MKRYLLLFLIILLFTSPVYGATIHGTIYDIKNNPASGVYVEVNSEPTQRHISKYGGYSFELEPGNYTLKVYLPSNDSSLLIAQHNVSVKRKGNYVVDLYAEENQAFNIDSESNSSYLSLILFGVFAILILVLGIILISKYGTLKKSLNKEEKIIEKKDKIDSELVEEIKVMTSDDVVKKRILKLMLENDGKITQKEIRKKISLSEAKISQLLKDLQEEKRIKKVKQGRINIIVKV